MVAHNRAACVRRTRAGLHLARARSSAPVCRRCRPEETRAAIAEKLPVRVGNEPAQNRQGNSTVGPNLERTLRRMKKTIITLIQLVVTIALLIWVFHDPAQRAQMAVALRAADYRWVGGAILAYIVVEVAAAIRWQVLLRVQK